MRLLHFYIDVYIVTFVTEGIFRAVTVTGYKRPKILINKRLVL